MVFFLFLNVRFFSKHGRSSISRMERFAFILHVS
uniref:Uncharacterized protein n=1 Tax=Anguilla anguilla TaxID=7936 RepID=A0A0E9V0W5_ANGAN